MTSFWRSHKRRENDLDDEIRAHLDMATRDRIARGESPEDAARAARREFGDVVTVREVTGDMWSGQSFARIAQDVRWAVRSLRRAPGFTIVAILTLALGIGANTAIFSVVNGVLLEPLPFPKSHQLVYITSQFPTLGFDQFPVDAAEYLELRERNRSFQDVGAYVTSAVNIGAEGHPARVTSAIVTASLFPTLGVAPRLGRTFTPEEMLPNAAAVAVLSSELWQSAFAADRGIIGRQIDVDGAKTTVVGIMPPGFDVHDQNVKIWLPLTLDPAQRQQFRGGHFLLLVGRLAPNVTIARAKAELQTLLAQWPAIDGNDPNAGPGAPGFVHTPNTTKHRLRYDDLQKDMVGSIGTALVVLQAAVALVLLIACANMANLLLMRAETRHKELAVRVALGAGRTRLMRQFVAESLVLSVTGAAAGLALAYWGLHALVAANAGSIPRAASVTLDAPVLVFTLLLAIGTGLLFSLAPLLHLSANSIGLALRDAGSRTTAGAARNRVRRGLVIAEMAFAVMLVVGAGLLLRSFWNLMRVDSGFDRAKLTTFGVVLPASTYRDSTRRVAFFNNLTTQLAAVPGVRSVAAMSGLPPLRQVNANDTGIEGFVPTPNGPAQNVDYYQYVTPDYVQTMGIPVVSGRAFEPRDRASRDDQSDNGEGVLREVGPDWTSRPTGRKQDLVHDHRCAQGRETGRCRFTNRHGAVLRLRANARVARLRAAQHERRHSLVARAGNDCGHRTAHSGRARPDTADRAVPQHGRGLLRFGEPAALPRAVVRHFRRRRPRAGRDRHVRRARLLRGRPAPRARHSYGPRLEPEGAVAARARAGHGTRRARAHCWTVRCARGDATCVVPAVRREASGSADVRGGRAVHAARRLPRLPRAGASRDPRRSPRRPPGRVAGSSGR